MPAAGEATFNIFLRSVSVGFERSNVERTDTGWIIRANGQVTAPVALETARFEMEYNDDWQPRRLSIEGTRGGTSFGLESIFEGSTVTNELREGSEISTSENRIDPTSIVLPNFFFAAYEALASRLSNSQAGAQIPIYVAPRTQITAYVNTVNAQRLETAAGTFQAKIFGLTFDIPNQPLNAEIWVDEQQRLLRVSVPSASIDVARQDIISVSTRLTNAPHPGDENVRVAASGFSLAATVTTPVDTSSPTDGRWPAVLLVPGSGSIDRDSTAFGIPIFHQLANSLAQSGFMVMRYDKRGIGQSGGRVESATLEDYANDVRQLVQYLERRNDVDRNRIIVVGYSEGGWVSLLAARRENKIKALALIATGATSGDELVLEQQQTILDQLGESDSNRQEKLELQRRIHRAVLRNGTWDGIPDVLRKQADTVWFRSFLAFDPLEIVRRVRQPLLIIQGELDQQVLAYHSDRMESLAQQRSRKESTVEVAKLNGINHLLVPVMPGSIQEYVTLPERQITPRVSETLVDWIERTLP